MLILDGFDEIHPTYREQLLSEYKILVYNLKKSKVILTSRSGDFPYRIENTTIYEIAPLSVEQIEESAKKWLTSQNYNDFLLQIKKSPFFDTTMRPLTLRNLCAIYEKYGKIPDKPKTVYKMVVKILLED